MKSYSDKVVTSDGLDVINEKQNLQIRNLCQTVKWLAAATLLNLVITVLSIYT